MTTIESGNRQVATLHRLRGPRSPRFALRGRLLPAAPAVPTVSRSIATWVTGAVAALATWIVLFAVVISRFQFAHAQHDLYGKFREQVAAETAPVGGVIAPGSPVSVFDIPTIGVRNLVVVEGTASGDLESGPGHLRNTPLPGQAGLSAIYGRAGLYGAPLGRIASLEQGDLLRVTTGQGQFEYEVERVRRAGNTYVPDLPSSGSRITFVTSDGSGWRSGWAPAGAVYVDAALVGKPVAGAPGRPASVPRAEKAMHGDPDALYAVVLWLGLLVLVLLATVWGFSVWGTWNTWLAGTPVVLAVLWGCTESASRLLPNLM